MSIPKIRAIQFNHPKSEALNLRWNHGGGLIVHAEWREGRSPAPAAFPVNATPSLRIHLEGARPNAQHRIRAHRAVSPTGAILGEVPEVGVCFNDEGAAVQEIVLATRDLCSAGVGRFLVRWCWEVKDGGEWVEIGETEHAIFVTLGPPTSPWLTDGGGDLPWVDALEVACDWAQGAVTAEKVAENLTRAVNERSPARYNARSNFLDISLTRHLLTKYLAEIAESSVLGMSCKDCAAAVVTLGNLLGCDLDPIVLWIYPIETKKVLLLGGVANNPADWRRERWGTHEVAWPRDSPVSVTGRLYDACLQLNVDNVPTRPVGMKFGEFADGRNYRHWLLRGAGGYPVLPGGARPQDTERRPVI